MSDVKKKGFISIFGIILLQVCLVFVAMMSAKLIKPKQQEEKLAMAELFAIQYAKKSVNSENVNIQMEHLGFRVHIEIENFRGEIKISAKEKTAIHAFMIFDAEKRHITSYEYDRVD